MPIVSYNDSGVSPRTAVHAAREMLKHAEPVMVLEKMGLTKPIPPNESMTVVFRRPRVFAAATVPLVEGVTPASHTFRYDDVQATLQQYGEVVEVSDVIEDTHEDPVLTHASMMAGENIGRTKEALIWGVLRAGTNVTFANGTLRTSVNTPFSFAKQAAITRSLKNQKAKMITSVLDASINYATRPVQASYVCVAHTDLEYDIRALPGFVPTSQYARKSPICDQEIGACVDVRYVLSPDLDKFADAGGAINGMISTTGSNADVYPMIFFGREAFGVVPLRGKNAVSPTVLPVGQKTKDDPLGQRGYVGWKMWHTSLILNQNWLVRAEVAATAL